MRSNSYRVRCTCGGEIFVRGSAAGAMLACPVCHALAEAPCLSDLKRLPPAPAGDNEMGEPLWFQFSIAEILQWTAVAGVVCMYARVNPVEAIIFGVLLVWARISLGSWQGVARGAFLLLLVAIGLIELAVLFLALFA